MHGQGCCDLFERSITVPLAEKIEPKGGQALFIEEASHGLVGCTVLAGEKSMAQQGETRCWPVGRAEDCGNVVTMAVMKGQRFFQGVVFQSNRILGGTYFRMREYLWSPPVAQLNTMAQDT